MNKHYVYFHKKADDGSIFYVGVGVGRRAYRESNRSNFWKRIANKHGYTVEFPHTKISQAQAKQLEVHYISVYGRMDNGTGILCNMTNGGDGRVGYKCTEETKEKMRKAATGVKFTDERKYKIGQKSKERRAWLSANKAEWTEERRIKASNSRKDKIAVICNGIKYDSLTSASKTIGINPTSIKWRCKSDNYPEFRFA